MDQPTKAVERRAIVVVLALTCCLVTMLGFGELRGNEHDVLPVAKQFADPTWLPRDWYLNLPPGYRLLFSVVVGAALKHGSFPAVVFIGRTLIFLAFACACVALCRAYRVSLLMCIPWVYLYLPMQSLAAGEWILKSLETKPFAYVAALLALAAFAQRRYRAMAAWLGAAISFHVLVGAYACVCTLACLLLADHRHTLQRPWRWCWPGIVTGFPGLVVLVDYALQQHGGPDAEQGALIYVTFRVPHHVVPTMWPSHLWPLWLGLCLWAAISQRKRDPRYREVSQYMLASAALFGIGLGLWGLGQLVWLRFYWFRFGDTMLPLLAWFLLAMRISDTLPSTTLPRVRAIWAIQGLLVGTTLSLYFLREPLLLFGEDARRAFHLPGRPPAAMNEWIRTHTPRDAVFLIDPTLDDFYVGAERATFVTFKHAPQAESQLVEWHARLMQATANSAVAQSSGLACLPVLKRGYGRLGRDDVLRISSAHGLRYMLTENGTLPFAVAHRVDGWALYELADKVR